MGHRSFDLGRGTLLGPEGTSIPSVVGVGVPLVEVVGWQSSSLNGSWPVALVGVVVGSRWVVVAGPSVL